MISEMAEKADRSYHGSSECSPTIEGTHTPMGRTPLSKAFDRILGFANSWRRNTVPRGRRIFHRDVEQDEFQYASPHCLSSYYSVFVVRLAIMVGVISLSLSLHCCIISQPTFMIKVENLV